jgi:hypothetical protein
VRRDVDVHIIPEREDGDHRQNHVPVESRRTETLGRSNHRPLSTNPALFTRG